MQMHVEDCGKEARRTSLGGRLGPKQPRSSGKTLATPSEPELEDQGREKEEDRDSSSTKGTLSEAPEANVKAVKRLSPLGAVVVLADATNSNKARRTSAAGAGDAAKRRSTSTQEAGKPARKRASPSAEGQENAPPNKVRKSLGAERDLLRVPRSQPRVLQPPGDPSATIPSEAPPPVGKQPAHEEMTTPAQAAQPGGAAHSEPSDFQAPSPDSEAFLRFLRNGRTPEGKRTQSTLMPRARPLARRLFDEEHPTRGNSPAMGPPDNYLKDLRRSSLSGNSAGKPKCLDNVVSEAHRSQQQQASGAVARAACGDSQVPSRTGMAEREGCCAAEVVGQPASLTGEAAERISGDTLSKDCHHDIEQGKGEEK